MLHNRWYKMIIIYKTVTIVAATSALWCSVSYAKPHSEVSKFLSKECKRKKLNCRVVKALAITESGLNPHAKTVVVVGKKFKRREYCRGIFQILDSTARRVCKIKNTKELYNYRVNIRCGIKYFDMLLSKYKNYDHAVLAFNAGYYDRTGIPFNIKYLHRVKANMHI